MSDATTRAAEALDALPAELAHADTLITEQQTCIEKFERHVSHLQIKLNTQGP
jgi:hypothetical protein